MYMWTQIVVILLSFMLGTSVSYGQGTKAPAKSKPVRFTQGGYEYTVQSALRDGRLEMVVRYTSTATRSSVQPGEIRVALGRKDASITSRAGDGSTIALTQTGPRLTAVYSHGGKTTRKEGSEAGVMRFVEDQDKANATRRPKTDSPFGKFTATDPALRAKMKKSILQTIKELKERRKDEWDRAIEEWERRCREDPQMMGCPQMSLCGRAGDCCGGGSAICCAVGVGCDFFEWLTNFEN